MLVSLNKYGKRVSIDEAKDGESYFCPVCHQELILKKGNIRVHHFSHSPSLKCTDSWHYDMSEWHKWWQALFPLDNQEIAMEANDEKHRADVFINGTVIEFQHSPLSCDEFDERNRFYTGLGYKVVWIFDVRDEYQEERIYEIPGKNNVFGWDYAFHTLENYNPERDRKISIYLHFEDYVYETDNKEHPCLYKIRWISPDGMKRFVIDGNEYHEFDVVEFKGVLKEPVPSRVYNDMINNHKKCTYGHGNMFFGCPISKSGYAVTDLDYNGDQHGKCFDCKYKFDYYKCSYPEKYLEIPENSKIIKVERDKAKFVKSVTFLTDQGKEITRSMPESNHGCSTIEYLWIKNEVQNVAIFRDIKTDFFVKVTGNPRKQIEKYGKVYGIFSTDRYKFPSRDYSKPISGFNEPRWTLIWSGGTSESE